MKELTCIVVEDEAISRRLLEKLCNKNDYLNLQGCFETGMQALEFLLDNPVDLILLDIEMPDMKGWELLDLITYTPLVIVISANKDYAYDAFQYKVADFIEKPLSSKRLDAALIKVTQQNEQRKLLRNKNEIYVKSNGKLIRLDYNSILYFESLSNYIKIVTLSSKFVIYCSIQHIENRLPSHLFYKIHRSYIINLTKIEFIEDNSVSINGNILNIARSQKTDFLERLNLL